MPLRLTHEYVKTYIGTYGYTLISKDYNTSTSLLDIRCGKCGEEYKQTFTRFQQGYQHPRCPIIPNNLLPFGGYKKPVTLKPVICIMCNNEFQPVNSKVKLCTKSCATDFTRTDEYKANAVLNGRKGGKVSATSQNKRSKNEIYFSELCAKEFDVTINEPFFDGWDADVIIHSEKTAILWNGIWHYKQISKTQSLNQVQTRDKIKTAIIEKYGYTPYVVKDMGKYNRAFVEQEFEIFKLMRICI